MSNPIPRFLLVEALAFIGAALVHAGMGVRGYEHRAARTAEAIIAAVLVAGLVTAWLRPARTRTVGLLAQAFALSGTLVGIFTTIVGVGPRTVPDVIYHAVMVGVLVCGLVVAARARPSEATRS